jgi:hypothetical protein
MLAVATGEQRLQRSWFAIDRFGDRDRRVSAIAIE